MIMSITPTTSRLNRASISLHCLQKCSTTRRKRVCTSGRSLEKFVSLTVSENCKRFYPWSTRTFRRAPTLKVHTTETMKRKTSPLVTIEAASSVRENRVSEAKTAEPDPTGPKSSTNRREKGMCLMMKNDFLYCLHFQTWLMGGYII